RQPCRQSELEKMEQWPFGKSRECGVGFKVSPRIEGEACFATKALPNFAVVLQSILIGLEVDHRSVPIIERGKSDVGLQALSFSLLDIMLKCLKFRYYLSISGGIKIKVEKAKYADTAHGLQVFYFLEGACRDRVLEFSIDALQQWDNSVHVTVERLLV